MIFLSWRDHAAYLSAEFVPESETTFLPLLQDISNDYPDGRTVGLFSVLDLLETNKRLMQVASDSPLSKSLCEAGYYLAQSISKHYNPVFNLSVPNYWLCPDNVNFLDRKHFFLRIDYQKNMGGMYLSDSKVTNSHEPSFAIPAHATLGSIEMLMFNEALGELAHACAHAIVRSDSSKIAALSVSIQRELDASIPVLPTIMLDDWLRQNESQFDVNMELRPHRDDVLGFTPNRLSILTKLAVKQAERQGYACIPNPDFISMRMTLKSYIDMQ